MDQFSLNGTALDSIQCTYLFLGVQTSLFGFHSSLKSPSESLLSGDHGSSGLLRKGRVPYTVVGLSEGGKRDRGCSRQSSGKAPSGEWLAGRQAQSTHPLGEGGESTRHQARAHGGSSYGSYEYIY